MTTTLSLVPIQALSTTNADGIQMSGPYILVRATTVAQQVQATRQLGKKPISPSPKEPEALRCKRRTDSNGLHNILPRPQPAAVARRNERERNRVKLVNSGFDTLREHVPFGKKNKKMSKVDTLKAASDYIKYLQEILNGDTDNVSQQSSMVVDSGDSNSGDERLAADLTDMNNFNGNMQNNNNNNNNNVFTTLQNSEQLNNFSFCAALNDNTTFTFAQSPTVSGTSSQNSPAPSMNSDAISESFSSEDEELPDLGSWFS